MSFKPINLPVEKRKVLNKIYVPYSTGKKHLYSLVKGKEVELNGKKVKIVSKKEAEKWKHHFFIMTGIK